MEPYKLTEKEINLYLLEAEGYIKFAQFYNGLEYTEGDLIESVYGAYKAILDLMEELNIRHEDDIPFILKNGRYWLEP
jgi:hypothetical protein